MTKRPQRAKPMRCPSCEGGLYLDDPAYGLTCPRCEIRVAGPFEDANEIPEYVPAPCVGTAVATIRFRTAANRRGYLLALRARLNAAGYDPDRIDDMFAHSFPPGELIGHVYGRDDAESAVDVHRLAHDLRPEALRDPGHRDVIVGRPDAAGGEHVIEARRELGAADLGRTGELGRP